MMLKTLFLILSAVAYLCSALSKEIGQRRSERDITLTRRLGL